MLRLQRKCECGGAPDCDCDSSSEKKHKDELHRAPAELAAPHEAPPIVHEVLRSPGQMLDAETRAFFESRFSRDFSGVRIHSDSRAAQSARAVNAHAYTVGSDIAFAPGKFTPRTREGRSLLAHELTHVVQQPNLSAEAVAKNGLAIGPPGDSHEREADRTAERFTQDGLGIPSQPSQAHVGPPRVASRSSSLHIQRQSSTGTTGAAVTPTPPTPLQPPASVPAPGPADFQIDRVAASTQSQIFFARNSSTLTFEALFEITLLKNTKPGTVELIGHASGDEAATIAQDRADAVKAALIANPDPVTVSAATGNAGATENRSDFSHARSVEIVPAGGVASTLDCKKTDAHGKLVNPPKQPCTVMDSDTWTAFNKALPIAEEATKKAAATVSATPGADEVPVIDRFFGNHDAGTLSTLKTNLGNLASHVGNLSSITSCGGQCDVGGCDEGPIAYNSGVGPTSPMTLCVPTFKNLNTNDEARNLIHESAHGTSPLGGARGKGTEDVAYRHERMLFELPPADRLRNSDSYALFAMTLREVRTTGNPAATPAGIDVPESDNLTGFSDPEKPAAKLAMARLEKRLTWSSDWLGQLFGSVVKVRGGTNNWGNVWGDFVMAQAATEFPLTAPPAVPSSADQIRLAAIADRYKRMQRAVKTDLTLTRGATGVAQWAGTPSSSATPPASAAPARWVAKPSLEIGPDFFLATPDDQVSLLLEKLAKATRDVEDKFVPAYVALAEWIHKQNP